MSKLGVVFAGGGGRGSYQAGVWKALKLFGIDKHVEMVSGASIGALNAMMFIQDDFQGAEDTWLSSSQESMFPVDEKIIIRNLFLLEKAKYEMDKIVQWANNLSKDGTITRGGLIEIMENRLDYERLKNSKITCYVSCCRVPDMEAEYLTINNKEKEEIQKILFATSAVPLVFEGVFINGKQYMDGGLKDNMPVKPLYDEGCDVIIAIYFNKEDRIDKSLYKGCKIIEIFQKESSGWITGGLDFSKEASLNRIIEGYKDGLKIFDGILERDYDNDDIIEILKDKYEQIIARVDERLSEDVPLEVEFENGIRKIKQMMIIKNNLKQVRKNNIKEFKSSRYYKDNSVWKKMKRNFIKKK